MPEPPHPSAAAQRAPTVDAPDKVRDDQRSTQDSIASDAPTAPGGGRPPNSPWSPPSVQHWAQPTEEWSAPSVVAANGATGYVEPKPGRVPSSVPGAAPRAASSRPAGPPSAATAPPHPPAHAAGSPAAAPGHSGAPRPAGAQFPTGTPAPAGPVPPQQRAPARGPRRARLQLRHIDPWTVLRFSCVLSVALFFVWLITIGVLYGILDVAGVVSKINDTVTTINGTRSNAPITPGIVFGGASLVGVVNIILFIALSTIGAVVYNLCADLVGGIEITLSEREA